MANISANRRAMYELIHRYESGMATAIQMATNLWDISVVFEGAKAYVEGRKIVLPNVNVFALHDDITDEDVENARAYFMALRGYAWHAAARIVETDTEQMTKLRKEHGSFAMNLVNMLDCIRVEHRFSKHAVGIGEAIEYMREKWVWPRVVRRKAQPDAHVHMLHEAMAGLQVMLKHSEAREDHVLWQALEIEARTFVERNQDALDAAYDTFKMAPKQGTERLIDIATQMLAQWGHEYDLVEPLCAKLTKPESDAEALDFKVERGREMMAEYLRMRGKVAEDIKQMLSTEASDGLDEAAALFTAAMKPPILLVTIGPRVTTLVSKKFAGGYVQHVEPLPVDKAGWDALRTLAPSERRTMVIHPPDPRLEKMLDDAMGEMLARMASMANEVAKQAEEAIENARVEIEKLPSDQQPYLVYTTKNDVFVTTPEGSLQDLTKMRDTVNEKVGVVKRRLQVLLRTKTRTRWKGNCDDGETLDGNAMTAIAMSVRMPNMELRPFRKRVDQDALSDTVCGLLTDVSGSMRMGSKLTLAKWATLCFAEALEQANVRFASWAFTNQDQHWMDEYDQASEADRKLYSRFGALYIETTKAFHEPWRSCATRLPQMGSYNDCNYDADSVLWAAKQLLTQKAKRRVMLVLSDGQPSTSEPPHQQARQQRHLRDVVAAMTAQGVEVVGIGICDDSVRSYYPHAVVIHQANDLPKVVMSEMEFLLLNARRAR